MREDDAFGYARRTGGVANGEHVTAFGFSEVIYEAGGRNFRILVAAFLHFIEIQELEVRTFFELLGFRFPGGIKKNDGLDCAALRCFHAFRFKESQ